VFQYQVMSKTATRLALICALAGLIASGAAAYTHYRLLSDPTYLSFCDVSETVSCTQVYASRFGSVGGIPVAVFGALWFAFATLLVVAAMLGGPSVRESVPGYLFAGSTLALAAILYLGYASFVILKLVCPLCLMTYGAVIGLFLVSGAVTSIPMTSLPSRAIRDVKHLAANPLAVALAVLFIGGAVSTVAFFPREGASVMAAAAPPPAGAGEQRSELERFMAGAPRVPLVIPSEGAKVLVVKFNDYQCPACGQSYEAYKPIFAKYEASHPGQVRLVSKDYPLHNECNSAVTTQLHPGACAAAVAVRLARRHDRADELEAWLFANQQGMTRETVREAAREIGQVKDFDQQYSQTLEAVKADIALGQQLGIRSTPTFFINGVKIEGAMAPQFFDQAIGYELQREPSQ
jgi:uncharacterized membrane protein/protein-disulfide isomerase